MYVNDPLLQSASILWRWGGQICILTFGALAVEGVDFVDAFAVVETRLAGTFVCVDMAEDALVS